MCDSQPRSTARMRLYYMTDFDAVTKFILPERRMRLSRFDKLNDPFELLCSNMGNPIHRNVLTYLREAVTKRWGIICMGKHWKSPLMWAHYAKNHTGLCLGFDVVNVDYVKQVKYTNKRVPMPINTTKPLHGVTMDHVHRVLITKYAQWRYEEEWRMFGTLTTPDPINGDYYLPFGPDLILREVIVGASCNTPLSWFEHLLQDLDAPVTITKARPAFQSFTMVPKLDEPAITVMPSVPGIPT